MVSGLLVAGHFLAEGSPSEVVDKYSGEVAGVVHEATPAHVAASVTAGLEAVESAPLPPRRRAEILVGASSALRSRQDEVIRDYVAETGFTLRDAETELDRAAEILRLSSEEALRLVGEVVPVASSPGGEHRLAFTLRVPVGVVGAIAPFNAPLSTVTHKVAPAIAAGNAVVVKPARQTPLSAVHLCEALLEAGLPPPFLSCLPGPGSTVGAALLAETGVRYFTFTGSTEVGLLVKRCSGIAKTHLELGSSSATIVCADADVELAAELVVRGGYRKAGQVCTSVQRVFPVRAVADAFEEALARRVKQLVPGDPRRPETDVGPMIAKSESERALSWVQDACAAGARLVSGGERAGSLFAPALLADVPDSSRLLWDEVFAPIVALHAVDDVESAITHANSTRYGLQAGVFTRDIDLALHIADRLRVGGVMINDTSSYHADLMPYGGVRDSGYGSEGPKYATMDMTDTKIVVVNRQQPRTSTS